VEIKVEDGVGVKVGDSVKVKAEDGVDVDEGKGVGESAKDVICCKDGEYVGVRVGVMEARVVVMFPSARESEKLPSTKPMEASATMIPRNPCRRFFMVNSPQAALS
jgi:hypothetical protein